MGALTLRGIASYPQVFEPKVINKGDDPKYTLSILIPKGDPQIAQIEAEIEKEKNNTWPSGAPSKLKVALKDAAVEFEQEPKLHNYMMLSCASNQNNAPHVVGMDRAPLMNRTKMYPGIMVWVSVNIYTYNLDVSKGVTAGLNGVMVTDEEGPLGRLDNKPSADQLFAGVDGTETPAPTATTSAPPPPPTASAPPPPPPASNEPVMTDKAQGTYKSYIDQGWTDDLLVQHGLMVPPSA